MSASVGVVIVAYRSAHVVGPLLASLPGATTRETRVVVVDNSPEDDGLAEIVAATPHAELVLARDNPGYGAAVNRGVAALTDVEWIVVSNPDIIVAPGAIDTLIAAGERVGNAGLIGPLVRNGDGTVYPSARQLPSLRTGIGHALFARPWPQNPWTHRYLADDEIAERAAGWVSGSFFVTTRAVFASVNGFDEKYFMYFEDVDLGRRVGETGRRNLYVPSAEVTHVGGESTKQAPRAMVLAHHSSAYRYLADKYSAWYLWPLRVALRIGLAVRARLAAK